MTLSLKKAQEEADRVLGHMREAVVSVARMRFDAIIATGAMPGLVDEVAYLLNTGRYDMARNLLDLHEAYVEATVNFDIAITEGDDDSSSLSIDDIHRIFGIMDSTAHSPEVRCYLCAATSPPPSPSLPHTHSRWIVSATSVGVCFSDW